MFAVERDFGATVFNANATLTLARISCFATLARTRRLVRPPLAFPNDKSYTTKKSYTRSSIELREKDHQIDLADYSRLVVLFLVLAQYLTQL